MRAKSGSSGRLELPSGLNLGVLNGWVNGLTITRHDPISRTALAVAVRFKCVESPISTSSGSARTMPPPPLPHGGETSGPSGRRCIGCCPLPPLQHRQHGTHQRLGSAEEPVLKQASKSVGSSLKGHTRPQKKQQQTVVSCRPARWSAICRRQFTTVTDGKGKVADPLG